MQVQQQAKLDAHVAAKGHGLKVGGEVGRPADEETGQSKRVFRSSEKPIEDGGEGNLQRKEQGGEVGGQEETGSGNGERMRRDGRYTADNCGGVEAEEVRAWFQDEASVACCSCSSCDVFCLLTPFRLPVHMHQRNQARHRIKQSREKARTLSLICDPVTSTTPLVRLVIIEACPATDSILLRAWPRLRAAQASARLWMRRMQGSLGVCGRCSAVSMRWKKVTNCFTIR